MTISSKESTEALARVENKLDAAGAFLIAISIGFDEEDAKAGGENIPPGLIKAVRALGMAFGVRVPARFGKRAAKAPAEEATT